MFFFSLVSSVLTFTKRIGTLGSEGPVFELTKGENEVIGFILSQPNTFLLYFSQSIKSVKICFLMIGQKNFGETT